MAGDAREAAVADRVAAAAAELYGAEPEAFTERRKSLVAEAKTAGDKSAAAAIAALRKPTRAAWVVNRLARADPDAPARMAALAAALRDAERAKDGPRLRELSAERGSLIDALTAQALAAAGIPDPPSGLRDEIMATLTAAFADPATAAEFAAGTLTKAAHWSGFGFGFDAADLGSADGGADADSAVSPVGGSSSGPPRASSPDRAPRAAAATRDPAAERDAAAKRAVPRQASPSSPSNAAAPARPAGPARRPRQADAAGEQADPRPRSQRQAAAPPDEIGARRAVQQRRVAEERRKKDEERRAAQQQERLAREEAERSAQRRKVYEDGERTVVSAATAAAEAGLAEDRLAAEVRDLEERVTRAREDLAAARRRARHAEAAERRARQALERLPRP